MWVPIFDLRVINTDLKQEILEAVSRVLDHGQLILGPEVEEFEEQVARFIGTKYALGVSSGSSALYLALKACGVREGDEVVTTALTWVISSNAIRACGANPVFADVGDDFNIDPESVEKLITSRTKAIVPVHYAGHMCDMDKLESVAKANNLMIVEDAAQAFGASLNGKKAGSFSRAAGFSMNPMKNFGGYGEAGVVVTDDESVFSRLKRLRHAGTASDPKKIITNYCQELSLNHKMDTINAATLLVGLRHLHGRQEKRKLVATRYNERLTQSIERQETVPGEIHGRYVYPIRSVHRNPLKLHLESEGVETKIMHEPLVCDAPIYQDCTSTVNNARRVLSESLIIPSHEKLSTEQVTHVIELINAFEDA